MRSVLKSVKKYDGRRVPGYGTVALPFTVQYISFLFLFQAVISHLNHYIINAGAAGADGAEDAD